jgi:hypothetical protein
MAVIRYFVSGGPDGWTVYKDHKSITIMAENVASKDLACELAIKDGNCSDVHFRVHLSEPSGHLQLVYDSDSA